jgi:hypothetical protein
MLTKAQNFTMKSQRTQGYDALSASYKMSRCYKPIMLYRSSLKRYYNLFVKDTIDDDIQYLKNNNCGH